jgi:phosphonate transport system ATP-binding protein
MKSQENAISVESVEKTFGSKKALDNVSLSVSNGEMIALIGSSGSGKSTLLRAIAGLIKSDRNPHAKIQVLEKNIQSNGKLDSKVRQHRSKIAFIFQQFNLVRRLSVMTNVLIGLLGQIPRWRGSIAWFTKEEKQRALAALERVGLQEFAFQRASSLSGGQQQRVAIARALLQNADVIVADEPIASLDPRSAKKVMDALTEINKVDGKTVIVSLHQVDYAKDYCQRIVGLADGKVLLDVVADQVSNENLIELYGSEQDEIDFGLDQVVSVSNTTINPVPVAVGT